MSPADLRFTSLVIAIVVTLIGVLAFARAIQVLYTRVASGGPQPGRLRPVGKRLWMTIKTVLSHREFKGRPVMRVAHWFVMLSFPILAVTLKSGFGKLAYPGYAQGDLEHFVPWEWLTEFIAWASLLGIIWLIVFRQISGHGSKEEAAGETRVGRHDKPASRFLGSTRWQAYFVEFVIFGVVFAVLGLRALSYAAGVEGVTDEAGRIVTDPAVATLWHFPTTAWLGSLLAGMSDTAILNSITILSLLKVVISMAWLTVVGVQTTMGVAWHRFLALVNIYTRREVDGSKTLGAASPMLINGVPFTSEEQLEELDDDAVLGVGTIADTTWKQRLDLMTCTECGRCQELCPAWNTGKPLSPKLLVMQLRDHAAAVEQMAALGEDAIEKDEDGNVFVSSNVPNTAHSGDLLGALIASKNTGEAGVALTPEPLIGNVVAEEVLWDCTMCGACVEQCPVDIEHIDHVLGLRRHQVLMESAFPRELQRPFRSMETKANPYNQSPRKRLDWAKNLDFDVPVIGEDVQDAAEVDWVFWVGCAGAYDDKAKKTTQAIAELLHRADVKYAVLGNAETCTGDPARRSGNELLFQMLAEQAIETLNEANVKKIVVSCAHCFNTIANEYPELGGHFEVVHHTQLLNRLVREGALKPVAPEDLAGGRKVTYHDPCYLGRHNKVYEPPRELLGADQGLQILEMPRSHDTAMCCGAGGAKAWMEETVGTRISQARVDEAASTGAEVIATACPFCSQMLGSTPVPSGSEKQIEIQDVAQLMLDAVKRGDSDGDSE
ncbi:MAG: (Fe-S)-binding protein [Actinomycetaceae bacterium]|nr:(Fe-S)-binding protein [Actinomycetaceae bacterium]